MLLIVALLGASGAVLPRTRLPCTRVTVRNSRSILLAEKAGSEGGSETPRPPDEEGSSLDWDADWRKFTKEGGASGWRPEGRSAYSAQELATARASRTVNEIRSAVPAPSELLRDGRFWLALLVLAAVLPGLLAALSAAPRPGDVMV